MIVKRAAADVMATVAGFRTRQGGLCTPVCARPDTPSGRPAPSGPADSRDHQVALTVQDDPQPQSGTPGGTRLLQGTARGHAPVIDVAEPLRDERPPKTIAIDLTESSQAAWWSAYFGVTRVQLLAAIQKVGIDAAAVKRALGKE